MAEKNSIRDAYLMAILRNLQDAQKKRLELSSFDLNPQKNANIYLDIVRLLSSLELFKSMEIFSIYEPRSGISTEDFKKYLFENGFISYEINDDTAEYFLNTLTVPELKGVLKSNGFKSSGRKQELVERIIENDIKLNDKSKSILFTKKSRKFRDEWEWLIEYSLIFQKFDLQDFFSYQFEKEGSIEDKAIDYFSEHMDYAMRKHDFEYVLDCLRAKSWIYKYHKDCEGYLDFQMKLFSALINPFILIGRDYKSHYKINSDYFIEFKKLTKLFNEEVILESFDENWNFLNQKSDVVSKSDARIVLEKILNQERNDNLNKYLKENIFNNKLKGKTTLDDYF